jgi:hypothetical protein
MATHPMNLFTAYKRLNFYGYTPHGQVLTSKKCQKFPLLYSSDSEAETASYPVDIVVKGRNSMKLTLTSIHNPRALHQHSGIRHRYYFTLQISTVLYII